MNIVSISSQKNNTKNLSEAWYAKARARRKKRRKVYRLSKLHRRMLSAFGRLNYGVTEDGKRRYRYRKVTVIDRFNRHKFSKQLAGIDLENHFDGTDTLYYMSNGSSAVNEILITIDLDVKDGKGTREGVLQVEEYLNEKYFNGKLFKEDSTNGTGRHCSFWLHKLGTNAEDVNKAIDHMQDVIRQDVKNVCADIAGVDIQGTCDVVKIERINGQRLMTEYTNGRMVKIPRTAREREDEFMRAAILTIEDVRNIETRCQDTKPPERTRIWEPNEKEGYGDAMHEEDIAEYLDGAERLFKRLCKQHNHGEDIQAKHRYKVRSEHAGVALVILVWLYDHPNKDGSLPQARAEALWKDANDRDLISCTWNQPRWEAFRNFLSDIGYIDWTNNTYNPPGNRGKGKACKWNITDELYLHLTQPKTGGGSLVIQPLPLPTGQSLKPVKVMAIDDYQKEWAMLQAEFDEWNDEQAA